MSDPFYDDIVEALSKPLDRDRFELCAASLLTKEFPTLVPIRGGTDSGMDAATASNGPFLVATTGKDVLRNLTTSLKSHLKNEGSRRTFVLATSQELSQPRRRKLHQRAQKLGFSLLQIYPRAAMAERLYYEPRWCKNLLGLTGQPSALTLIPRTERPMMDHEVVARDAELRWLKDTSGDRLLVGQPGCGKTFLLRHLAIKGWGLFLVDHDREAIANAIRKQQPKVIIVDDAHFCIEALSSLKQLRHAIGAEFDIVATSWTGDQNQVAEVLTLPASQICELPLLTRDEIVEVIRHAGLGGPSELIREIVNQAEGRPGLAVTLSYLSLTGDVREVLYGNALRRSLITAFRRLVGNDVAEILAGFALGGDSGMTIESVAAAFGLSISELRASLVRLSAGGVLRQNYDKRLSVWPKSLRFVLVRDGFFSGSCDLPHSQLMAAVESKFDLAQTLIGAINRGATVPNIVELIESIDSPTIWQDYASLGQTEANFVLRNHPELIKFIGRETLLTSPEVTLPLLFAAAVGDERTLGNATNHPLRWVQDWIRHAHPNAGTAIERRSLVVRTVSNWSSKGGDSQVAIKALSLAFSPSFEKATADPGSGMKINIIFGLLSDSELSQLLNLWNETTPFLSKLKSAGWRDLLNTMHEWIYPEMARSKKVFAATKKLMRRIATQMVTDVLALGKDQPGIQQWARGLPKSLRINFEGPIDSEFETLFPTFDAKNWQAQEEKQRQDVLALAEHWRDRPPADVAVRLLRLETEAGAATQRPWLRRSPMLCTLLANSVNDPNEWLRCFIDIKLDRDLCVPFLHKAVTNRTNWWESSVATCFDDPNYEAVAVTTLLTIEDPPRNLLDKALQAAAKFPDTIHLLCLRSQVPETSLKALLTHADPVVAAQAAIGTWWAEPRGEIRQSIGSQWRAAILRTQAQQFYSSEILQADKSLAFDWLMARIDEKTSFINYFTLQEIRAAVSCLDSDQRTRIVRVLPDEGHFTSELLPLLATDDLEVCKAILAASRFGESRLRFILKGHPTADWVDKALLAFDAGYTAEQIVNAAVEHDSSWTGEVSDMWQGWIDDFQPFLTHDDARIRSVAELAMTKLMSRQADARKSERRAAVYGS